MFICFIIIIIIINKYCGNPSPGQSFKLNQIGII